MSHPNRMQAWVRSNAPAIPPPTAIANSAFLFSDGQVPDRPGAESPVIRCPLSLLVLDKNILAVRLCVMTTADQNNIRVLFSHAVTSRQVISSALYSQPPEPGPTTKKPL